MVPVTNKTLVQFLQVSMNGNTMVELNQFDTQNLDKHSDFYRNCAKFAKTEAAAVLKYFKETKNGKENSK